MCEPESDNLVEKIIAKINEAFEMEDIREMEILPLPIKIHNTTPIIVEENVLGIESWCLEYVSKYSYRKVMYWRKKKASVHRYELLKHYLNLVLFANPEISTFWNIKRELIENGYKFVEDDFYLTKVLLTLYPKSAQILAYRRWLSKFTDITEDFISNEFHICSLIAERKTNNYHAWAHRWWLLETISTRQELLNFLRIELLFTNFWVKKNVSQFSGLHYLLSLVRKTCEEFPRLIYGSVSYMNQHVIDPSLFESDLVGIDGMNKMFLEKIELIVKILIFNYNLIMYHENHESLWIHRQCLITFAIQFMYYYAAPASESKGKTFDYSFSSELAKMYKHIRMPRMLRDHIERDADLVHILKNPFVGKHVRWLIHDVNIFNEE